MLASLFSVIILALAAPTCGLAIVGNGSNPESTMGDNASDLTLSQTLTSPLPYEFPNLDNLQDLFPMESCNGVILEEATIDDLQDAMAKGQLTSTQITMCYLQRIYQTDQYTK